MSKRSEERLAKREQAYWRDVASILGLELIGWDTLISGTFRCPVVREVTISSGTADRLIALRDGIQKAD